MWLLITIILFNNSTTKVEVLEVFTNKAQCISRGNYASRIGIPEGMVKQCIPLKGVKKTHGTKLRERIRRLPQ